MQKKSSLKTIAKILLWIFVVLILVLGIAYWTAPSWVPGQVKKFLPPSIQLESLELKHPGLTSTDIDRVTLTLGDSSQYRVQLTGVELHYSLWQKRLTAIQAQSATLQWPDKSTPATESEILTSIPLPRLPVAEVSIAQLTIEDLTLQPVVAQAIQLTETDDLVNISTKVLFLNKAFDIKASAERHEETLSRINATMVQGENQLTLMARPNNSKNWELNGNGAVNPQDYYPQPGISPIKLTLAGTVDFSDEFMTLALEPATSLSTEIRSDDFELAQTVQTLLTNYHIKTNIDQLEPSYQLTLSPLTPTQFSFSASESTLNLTQGQFGIQFDNPSVTADVQLSQLQLDLTQALTHQAQSAELAAQFTLKDIEASYDSPEHSAVTNAMTLALTSELTLDSSKLSISTQEGKLGLGDINYKGNNSTGSISASQWSFAGSSILDFKQAEQSQHQWSFESKKRMNGVLNLSNEQFKAADLSAKLQFSKNQQLPSGKLQGNYSLSNLSLQQQPLKLDSIKGELDLVLNNSPKGKLHFDNARYDSKQIGASNIAGEVNWQKKQQTFIAKGTLKHDQSKIPFDYSFNLKSSRHKLSIDQSSLPVSTITSWLNVLKDYPELSFSSGQLEIDSLDGDPIGLLFDGKLKLDNFNLNYDEFYVRNWTIEDTLSSSSKLGGTLKSHIDSIELATDIAITDVSFLMPHTINSLVITDLKGQLLNGKIAIPKLAINEEGIPPFTAYLKSIDIGALLTALNSEKLKLTGLFDFTLPLTLSKEGQQITAGKFNALGEGVIQLKSDNGKEANIAFQALENFHYQQFSGTLDYNLEGDYVVELHVLGSNPKLYSGFPIKLDLTLRGQLPELLYSMLISGDMTKPILDDLEQKQMLNIQR